MINSRLKQKASVAGAAVDLLTEDFGYVPYDRNEVVQVWATGLDGGTWDVKAYMPAPNQDNPSGGALMTLDTALTGVELYTIDSLIFAGLRVEFAGLGGGAAPIVFWTTRVRR